MRVLMAIVVLLALTVCATREIKVNCDGKLQPVNTAAKSVGAGKAAP